MLYSMLQVGFFQYFFEYLCAFCEHQGPDPTATKTWKGMILQYI